MSGPEPVDGRDDAPRRRSGAVTALVALAALGFAVFAVLRAFGLEEGWPLVPALSFVPYVMAAAPLAAVAAGLLRRWASMAVLIVAAVVLAFSVVPRAVPFGVTASGGPTVRLMTLNTLGGGASVPEVVGLVRDLDVDVLTLQEVTPELVDELSAAGLDELLPHVVDHSHPRGVPGSTVRSAFPLTDLGDTAEGPGAFAMPTAGVELPGYGRRFEVTSVHVPPPLSPALVDVWRGELDGLAAEADPETTRVLAGDFNATLDHAALRGVLEAGYLDAAAVLGEGLVPTWPVGRLVPNLTIDHVLVGPGTGVDHLEVRDVTGTDHRAVFVEVSLPEGPG
ncbi:endonuclease/exonuclease/phosphatase family protein [Nocardiopsis halotolerans]|uniref:endonuclease/exonuclease/phosphatase family protein n=1 Tax=Nocardiopsis halotolerans TaxID=124252 RepID=UPI000344E70D|nr:endonuclease/exonuclease/phosphatase family protein [Nocardiopsis halotolerans]